MEHLHNATNRFSERADWYNLYRPQYPKAIIEYLKQTIGLTRTSDIADIGAGTGICAKLFLEEGYSVTAVEPNAEMRKMAEVTLNSYEGFRSIAGTGEETTLNNESVDLVTVAQAFHWFRPEETRKELERILRPSGHILLIWNIMQSDNPFLKAYTDLKKKYENPIVHPHRDNLHTIQDIFAPNKVITQNFRNTQQLDAEGFQGHFFSFSTIPLAGSDEMRHELNRIFDTYNQDGTVTLEYETKLYLIARKDQ